MSASDPAPTTAPAAAPRKKSWFKRILKLGVVLFVLVVIALIVLPTIATKTFLKGTVRSQLAKQTGGGDVSNVEFGWTTGLLVDGLTIPSAAPWAKVKDRPAVKLEHFATKLSVPGAIKAALTHGEVNASVEAEKASIYLELHPGGKTNINLPEKKAEETKAEPAKTEEKKTEEGKSAAKKELPCTAKALLDCKEIDLEIADCTSSTGAIQRTILKGLRIGAVANVARDSTATVDTLKEGANEVPTLGFDSLKITLEQPGKPDKLILAVDKPAIVAKATYAGPKAATADLAPLPALAAAHQVDAKPTIAIARVYGEDFDLNDLRMNASVESPGANQKVAKLTIDGILKGQEDGKIHVAIVADLCGKTKLPVTVDIQLDHCDMTGAVAKYATKLLPVIDGSSTKRGESHLPSLTFGTQASVAAFFDDGRFQKDPTLKSLKDDGNLKLGPGDFNGSKILEGLMEGYEKLDLKDVIQKALGGSPFHFDGVEEVFNVKDGVVSIPKLELLRSNLGIVLKGQCTFDGDYDMGMNLDQAFMQKLEPDVAKLLESVDKAGGIRVAGKVGGGYSVTTPPGDALAKAMIAGGAMDIFRKRSPKAAAKLDSALSKAGVNTDQIVNQPKEAAKTAAEKAAESKEAEKVEKKLGVTPDAAKKALGGLFGGDKKDDSSQPAPSPSPSPDDQKSDDQKKDEGLKLPFKNPFGGN